MSLHSDLILKAVDWVKSKGYSVIITDMTSAAGETPDCIAWNSWKSLLIECKASRSDFLRDREKATRIYENLGMGNDRLYMAPKGMIRPEDLTGGWGLLEVNGDGKVRLAVSATPRKSHKEHEITLLVSAIRRIGQNPPPGISVKCYTLETSRRATITIDPAQTP